MELKHQIITHFEKFITVKDSLKTELLNRVSLVAYEKGDLIVDANKANSKLFYILTGLTRTYFLKDGKEINEYFSSENEWANSPRNWRPNRMDIYYISAIESTTTLCIGVDDILFLFDNYPELDRYGRLSMIPVLNHLIDRIASFRFTSAKDKYIHFRQTYPKIHHRIPLGMVASYLGISQETLSRLRATK